MLLNSRHHQQGVTLLEALVSILILAVAVLGMLGVQLRTLAETQTGVRRGQAVRLIEDFSERIKSNPSGFARIDDYVSDFNVTPALPTVGCDTAPCDPVSLAQWDLAQWKKAVAETLPMGRARIFLSTDEDKDPTNRRQLGVMVGWRKNEANKTDVNYAAPFALGPQNTPAGVACPTDLICHLIYVQP